MSGALQATIVCLGIRRPALAPVELKVGSGTGICAICGPVSVLFFRKKILTCTAEMTLVHATPNKQTNAIGFFCKRFVYECVSALHLSVEAAEAIRWHQMPWIGVTAG